MPHNPFDVVRQFEAALCEYTGAPYCVTTTSCTAALMLAVAWHLREDAPMTATLVRAAQSPGGPHIEIPKRTYVGVAQSILNAGGRPAFRDENWSGQYGLRPLPVWDAARWFTSGMYECETLSHAGQMQCVSFHHTKALGLAAHGGAVLHDSPEADAWLR